jgi:hypothetical protein
MANIIGANGRKWSRFCTSNSATHISEQVVLKSVGGYELTVARAMTTAGEQHPEQTMLKMVRGKACGSRVASQRKGWEMVLASFHATVGRAQG